MISIEVLLAYTAACLLVIVSPGPDNLLAIGRGISQGKVAALVSSLGTALGVLVHAVAAALGLAMLIQNSSTAFMLVKIVGALYLLWLGINAIRANNLVSLETKAKQSMASIFMKGFLTNVLNPKPAIFILAFIPQFIDVQAGNVVEQSLFYGAWYAFCSFIVFSTFGVYSTLLAEWLKHRPLFVKGLNMGAGVTFITAGLSVAMLDRSR